MKFEEPPQEKETQVVPPVKRSKLDNLLRAGIVAVGMSTATTTQASTLESATDDLEQVDSGLENLRITTHPGRVDVDFEMPMTGGVIELIIYNSNDSVVWRTNEVIPGRLDEKHGVVIAAKEAKKMPEKLSFASTKVSAGETHTCEIIYRGVSKRLTFVPQSPN